MGFSSGAWEMQSVWDWEEVPVKVTGNWSNLVGLYQCQ